jgi:aminoglycoside 6'-N-acetyltransferase
VDSYLIRPFADADLPMVGGWREQPHVVEWWGEPSLEPETEKRSDPLIAMWIVEQDGRPFAFIQDYDVHGWDPHPFSYLPKGSRGLDLYIGEADMVGRGHGSAFLRQHVEHLFSQGVPAVGADPHPQNIRARRAYEKAGFAVVSDPLDTPWGRAILMDRFR